MISIILQSKILSGPPKHFTTDWEASKQSVDKLAALTPNTAATGHGVPMRGKELKQALQHLQNNFYADAVPQHGRYIPNPAIANSNGVIYVPPKKINKNELVVTAFVTAALLTTGAVWSSYRKNKRRRFNEDLIEVEYNY